VSLRRSYDTIAVPDLAAADLVARPPRLPSVSMDRIKVQRACDTKTAPAVGGRRGIDTVLPNGDALNRPSASGLSAVPDRREIRRIVPFPVAASRRTFVISITLVTQQVTPADQIPAVDVQAATAR
jgi:hypothetical protein